MSQPNALVDADARLAASSRLSLVLGLCALSPLLLWVGPLLLAGVVDALPTALADTVDDNFDLLYLLMWTGIALTAVFVPTMVGSIGLAFALLDLRRRRVARSLLPLVLNVLALVAGTGVAVSFWFLH